jgi:hypothetical protein
MIAEVILGEVALRLAPAVSGYVDVESDIRRVGTFGSLGGAIFIL